MEKHYSLIERLPPTEGAAFFHSLRVHHQVILLSNEGLCNGVGNLIMTDLDPAPDNMRKFIRCKCKLLPEILVELMFVRVARMDSSVYQHACGDC